MPEEFDELLGRMQHADPAQGDVSPDPSWIDTLAQSTMEAPMTTPEPAGGTRRTWILTAAAAAVVAAVGFGGYSALKGDDTRSNMAQEKSSITLTVPASNASAMCMRVTPETVAQSQVAFDGTVASVEGAKVTLDVSKWYVGGDAQQVVLTQTAPDQPIMLEGGVQLEQGKRYLVTAYDGRVNGCGFSAEWSQELQDIWDQAFPG
jgi:hypothetical protein